MGNLCGKLFTNTHAGKQRVDPPVQILGGYYFLNNKKFIDNNMIRNYLKLNLLVLTKSWNVSLGRLLDDYWHKVLPCNG